MYSLLKYTKEILFIAGPALIVFLSFTPHRRKALSAMKLQSSTKREIGLMLLVASIFAILALTLWPTYIWEETPGVWGNLRILIERPTYTNELSLMPFAIFKDYAEDLSKGPAMFIVTIVNFVGNLAMFVPIGLLSALLFRNATWKRPFMIGFGMSLFIEIAQYFIMRNSAVDDVILNTAGAMCGYGLYLILKKRFPRFTAGFLCNEC